MPRPSTKEVGDVVLVLLFPLHGGAISLIKRLAQPIRWHEHDVWLFRPPGVYRPQADTWLLADALRTASSVRVGARVLDAGTGTGVLALLAARAGAELLAVDINQRAVLSARVNARLRRLPIRVQRGDLFELIRDQVFDVVVANLPYVSSDLWLPTSEPGLGRRARRPRRPAPAVYGGASNTRVRRHASGRPVGTGPVCRKRWNSFGRQG